jgi:hypothetical protein
MVRFLRESIHRILTALLRAKQIFKKKLDQCITINIFLRYLSDIDKKNIFKKCNFLIIILFSQIAQAKTLEKFNVTCFPRG